MFNTERVANGQFKVFYNGKETQYTIFNGSAGMSGSGNNVYGIQNKETGKIKMIGSLQKAKKTAEQWLRMEEKKQVKKTSIEDDLLNEEWEPISKEEFEEKMEAELELIREAKSK